MPNGSEAFAGVGTGGRFGKYRLVARIGRGGMAEVWKAIVRGPGGFERTLVLKLILPHFLEDPSFVEMFMQEARISAQLNHANIVQVFELGQIDNRHYLAMEYVQGASLSALIGVYAKNREFPPPGLGVHVVREVCRALSYAHAFTDNQGEPMRLIHRDVSPSNIMLSYDGAVKLLDFGIAKAIDDSDDNSSLGSLKGKMGYLAPERTRGARYDHRADLFSVGVVLHETLTARRLFKGASDVATIDLVRGGQVVPPSKLNPAVPEELDRICAKACAQNPDDRYQDCDDLAADLEAVARKLEWGDRQLTAVMKERVPKAIRSSETTPTASMTPWSLSEIATGVETTVRGAGGFSKRIIALSLGVAAIAGVIIGAMFLSPRTTQTQPTPARIVEPQPPTPAIESPAQLVKLVVTSQPIGAEVRFNAEKTSRGNTPLTLYLPSSDKPLEVRVSLTGYRDFVSTVSLVADANVDCLLTAQPKSADPSARTPGKKSATEKIKKRGLFMDPFH